MARAKHTKKHTNRYIALGVATAIVVVATVYYFSSVSIPVLQPAGPIAAGQRRLLMTAFLLMLIVVLPVFALTFGFAWRYRESNKAKYTPNWDSSNWLEISWWLIPAGLITALAIITWNGTFKYDPYKPLAGSQPAMTVQVIALDWRWLFIYPQQHVASVNELYIPVGQPVKFELTADAPMNSFWIPQLGGQVYAMPGMGTRLYLQADKAGTYHGSSANISGEGFADMDFKAIATTQTGFNAWVDQASTKSALSLREYEKLAQPSHDESVQYFSRPASNLYEETINKYMMTSNDHNTQDQGQDHDSMQMESM